MVSLDSGLGWVWWVVGGGLHCVGIWGTVGREVGLVSAILCLSLKLTRVGSRVGR